MSVRLIILRLLGKIKPAEKIEAERSHLYEHYLEFLRVEQSDELKEFRELERFVGSSDFESRKKEITGLKFKGSFEYNQLKEYEKLKKSGHLVNYFSILSSADLKRFEAFKDSHKLKEYYELEEYVTEGKYHQEKREINSQVFSGSEEQLHLTEFWKLSRDKGIRAWLHLHDSQELKDHNLFAESEKLKRFNELKNMPERERRARMELRRLRFDQQIRRYFTLERSERLRLYRETCYSHTLEKYHELKKYVGSDSFKSRKLFLEDKKKFEKSEAWRKFQRFRALSDDKDIRFYLKYGKSRPYCSFLDVKDSFDLKRYNELREITSSKVFQERKAYLEDRRKWEKTDEFAKEQKYLKMKSLPHLVRYFGYLGTTTFDFFKSWEVCFEDNFGGETLDSSKWMTNSPWAERLLGSHYSMFGDLQCYTDGKNIKTGSRGLTLIIKKEKCMGKGWKAGTGFVPRDFEYTSGIISTREINWEGDGIFEAKIRYNPVKQVVTALSLRGEKPSVQVNIMESGVKNRVGIVKFSPDGKTGFAGTGLSGLKKGRFYLFRLHRESNTLTWSVNDRVLLRMEQAGAVFPAHIILSGIVVYDIPGSALPAIFEMQWIKCYRKRNA